MSPTCFEPEGSSSGRQLCIQLRYGTFCMLRCKQSSRWSIEHTLLLTTAVSLKMNPRVRNMWKTSKLKI